MLEPLSDGRANLRERPVGVSGRPPSMSANVQDLVGPMRTMMTTILGFADMLADPELPLTEAKRAEYEAIVRASSAALLDHVERKTTQLRAAS